MINKYLRKKHLNANLGQPWTFTIVLSGHLVRISKIYNLNFFFSIRVNLPCSFLAMPRAVFVGTKSKIFEKIKLYVSFIDKDSKSPDKSFLFK